MSDAENGTAAQAAPTAAILIIGNEILSGRTQDTNLHFIAQYLGRIGVRLREARIVPDVEQEIVAAVNHLRARYSYVLTTGGIGPTHDDITSAAMAVAFGVPLIRHPEAATRLERHYAGTGLLNEARMRMANTPEGARLIDNPVSSAPGFQIGNVFVMAGVPMVMQAMLTGLGDRLIGGPPVLAKAVISNIPEGTLADRLAIIQHQVGEAVDIGSYPAFRSGKVSTSLVLRSTDAASLDRAAEIVAAMIRDLGGQPEIINGPGS